MEYPLISHNDVAKWLPTIKSYKVSIKATSEDGFLTNYLKSNPNFINQPSDDPKYTWKKKRDLFLKRTLAAFKKKETIRRYFSLIAWAYEPEINDQLLKNKIYDLKKALGLPLSKPIDLKKMLDILESQVK